MLPKPLWRGKKRKVRMLDESNIPCNDWLSPGHAHPDERHLIAKIYRLIRRYDHIKEDVYPFEHSAQTLIEDRAPVRGLCVTCLKKDVCRDTSREGGIWHCQNYR